MGVEERKDALIADIVEETRLTASWTGRAALSERVLAALRKVRRELFVPPAAAGLAYENMPLPIGHGQTISQPYIVAITTELLDLPPGGVALDVGTGSGYQAAVLAEIAARVYGIEVIPELADVARRNLARAGYANVEVRTGDGYDGWPEHAPYDAIAVAAAAPAVPAPLVAQLKPGGRMVIPIGGRMGGQRLVVVTRLADGRTEERPVLDVAFVPFVRNGRRGNGEDPDSAARSAGRSDLR